MKREKSGVTGRAGVWSVAAAVLALLIGGCSSYQLRGKVVEGPVSSVQVLEKDDERFRQPGLAGAQVAVTVDPGRLNRTSFGPAAADEDGRFALPVDKTGAGLLEYDAQVIGQLQGYQAAEQTLRLPSQSKRVLITLAPGSDSARREEPNLLDETIRLSEPYLRE